MTKSTAITESTESTTESKPKANAWKPCTCFVQTGEAEITVGCGEHTRKRFAMGHDAKTKSTLQKMFRAGVTDVKVIELDGSTRTTKIATLFEDLDWVKFMTPDPAIARKAKAAAERAAAKAKAEAATENVEEEPAPKTINRRSRTTMDKQNQRGKAKVTA